ncbi:predicted protein [Coccidioides posadasii str. Silveira]|uniref:Predicted protein n=1 Tax=Coccidioides posadasii (strain RMSCC 757 / Silveira) TaxID=443226 RepID=E9DH05_COCPS|nr:predicted protein [Coccidioides posadasii str. Silveira]
MSEMPMSPAKVSIRFLYFSSSAMARRFTSLNFSISFCANEPSLHLLLKVLGFEIQGLISASPMLLHSSLGLLSVLPPPLPCACVALLDALHQAHRPLMWTVYLLSRHAWRCHLARRGMW